MHAAFNYDLIPSGHVESYVLANAGARPLDRDSVDVTAVRHTRTRTGARIASQNEMGGWPKLAQNQRPLQIPAEPHVVPKGQAFRTNIELWLEGFATALEPPHPTATRR